MTKLAQDDGRQLAVDLLRQLETMCASDECFMENGRGDPQNNVVSRYLEALRERDNVELTRGFAAVLTDFIAGAYSGSACDPETYEDADVPARK